MNNESPRARVTAQPVVRPIRISEIVEPGWYWMLFQGMEHDVTPMEVLLDIGKELRIDFPHTGTLAALDSTLPGWAVKIEPPRDWPNACGQRREPGAGHE